MPLVSGVIVVVFGGLTLLLQDELFIKLDEQALVRLHAEAVGIGVAEEEHRERPEFEGELGPDRALAAGAPPADHAARLRRDRGGVRRADAAAPGPKRSA
jgi:hypothetical protein